MQSCIMSRVLLLLLFSVFSNPHPARVKRYSESCSPYNDDLNPIRFPDPENCQNYLECNTSHNAVPKSCGYGYWFDDKTKDCKDVDQFPPKLQQNCINKIGAPGTTPKLKDVFIGRCLEYQTFRHPEFFVNGQKDCKQLYRLFTKAFQNKNACGKVKFGDYNDFLEATRLDLLPKDKLLFWSAIRDFSQHYANGGKRLFTLEETLLGYLVNDLTWCGKKAGINFKTCPTWGICDHHPMVTFWEEASEHFAKLAVDTITLMVNGSNPFRPAFTATSFFARHELPSLTDKINKVRIWVAHGLELPALETCNKGSLLQLKELLAERGFNFNCQDNPAGVAHLLCVDNPFHPDCKNIKVRRDKWNNGQLFDFEVEPLEE